MHTLQTWHKHLLSTPPAPPPPPLLKHLYKPFKFWLHATANKVVSCKCHFTFLPEIVQDGGTRPWRHGTAVNSSSSSQIAWHVSGYLLYHSAANCNEFILKVSAISKGAPSLSGTPLHNHTITQRSDPSSSTVTKSRTSHTWPWFVST
jgi:hypothetical protein